MSRITQKVDSCLNARAWLTRLLLLSFVSFSTLASATDVLLDESSESPEEKVDSRSGYVKDKPTRGGRRSVVWKLLLDDLFIEDASRLPELDRSLQPYYDWKRRVRERYGLQLGTDYSSLMQGASHSLSDTDTASGGVYRLYGRWFNPKKEGDSGSLIFKIEHSHSYLDQIPPEELAGQIGYLGSTGTQFSDQKLVLNDFNWLQDFNGGNGAFVLGRYDVKDYMDVVDYADPWTTFQNNNILENHSIALPDTSYGVGASHWLGGQWVVLASVTDANGSLDDLAAFRYGAEFFSFVELGWSPSTDTYDLKSIHLTLWHVDERTHDDKPEGKGAALGGSWTFDRRWLVFARTGLSTGGASNMRHSSTFGFNYLSREYFDGFGLAINYAEPSDESLRDQSTMEMFFRMQISQNIAVTPSFQLLLNPALNPQQDHIEVYGLRFRIAL